MGSKKGRHLGGIRTIADLRARCYVDLESKCWEWRGAKSRCGSGNRKAVGMAWYAPAQRAVTLGSLICHLKTGKMPERGRIWYCLCDTPDCANPAHRQEGTQADVQRGIGPPMASRMKATATIRARSKIDEAAVHRILTSKATGRELAREYGVHPSCISRIRLRQRRVPLGASAFNWRPS